MEHNESLVNTLMQWIKVVMKRSMRHVLLYAKQSGFSMTQIAALFLISRKGSHTVSEISGELEITNPAGSQLLDRLVQQGLVVRSENPNDRRLKQISLSQQGEDLLQQCFQARHRWLEDLAKQMSPDEEKQVVDALTVMLEKAQKLEYPPPPES